MPRCQGPETARADAITSSCRRSRVRSNQRGPTLHLNLSIPGFSTLLGVFSPRRPSNTMASFLPRAGLRAFTALPRAAPLTRVTFASKLPRTQPFSQPLARRFLATVPQEQPRIRLGSTGIYPLPDTIGHD